MINNRSKYDLIKTPIITEKSTTLGEINKYVFKVSRYASKDSLKKAVESIFSVNVLKVNIINYKGKIKKFKGFLGRRSDTKKAIITLDKDQTIDLAGGIK